MTKCKRCAGPVEWVEIPEFSGDATNPPEPGYDIAEELDKFKRSIQHGDFDLAAQQMANARLAQYEEDQLHKDMTIRDRYI